MGDTVRGVLRDLLLTSYGDLRKRLIRRLGSAELADDALHDTFLRLETAYPVGPVHRPSAYLLRVALNIASNHRLAEARRLTVPETEALLEIGDEAPDPARVAEARSDIEALTRALAELPERTRDIFLAAWDEDAPYQVIADRFDVTVRTVQTELKNALEHCALRLDRRRGKNFALRPRGWSQN
jgi:RNA polymerase sigma-70 factor (ECF subfamily)